MATFRLTRTLNDANLTVEARDHNGSEASARRWARYEITKYREGAAAFGTLDCMTPGTDGRNPMRRIVAQYRCSAEGVVTLVKK